MGLLFSQTTYAALPVHCMGRPWVGLSLGPGCWVCFSHAVSCVQPSPNGFLLLAEGEQMRKKLTPSHQE